VANWKKDLVGQEPPAGGARSCWSSRFGAGNRLRPLKRSTSQWTPRDMWSIRTGLRARRPRKPTDAAQAARNAKKQQILDAVRRFGRRRGHARNAYATHRLLSGRSLQQPGQRGHALLEDAVLIHGLLEQAANSLNVTNRLVRFGIRPTLVLSSLQQQLHVLILGQLLA
jgi:hypothetical protein